MKIVFSGGGTLGPVTPLLAIHEILKEKYPDGQFIWVGTKTGPERKLVEERGIVFMSFSSGKLRRYFSFLNIVDLFKITTGFFESLFFLKKEKPDLCISAGGFVSVPLHWAAWFLRIPAWVHQQDVEIGLSIKLMVPLARVITTALQQNTANFPAVKTRWLGNPIRQFVFSGYRHQAVIDFGLKGNLPVVFATGGGTGSERVNQLVVEAVQHLEGVCEIIHLSGLERSREKSEKVSTQYNHYHHFIFFSEEMKDAYAVADIVISRGGFGTLTEIAALGKPAIIIPKPGHQEENVKFLADAGAIILEDERTCSGVRLASIVKELLKDKQKMTMMGKKLNTLLPIAKKEEILNIVSLCIEKK